MTIEETSEYNTATVLYHLERYPFITDSYQPEVSNQEGRSE
jgi:hypothetical protein